MRKSTFKITVSFKGKIQKKAVKGLVSNNFGIHKNKNETVPYIVTHLKTGYKIVYFLYMKQARDFVDRCEKAIFPIPWENITNPEQTKSNKKLTMELYELSSLL